MSPSVASQGCWISLGEGLGGVALSVLSIDGRLIMRRAPAAWPVWWDLQDDHGRSVPSGVYWVSVSERRGGEFSQRVVVLR